MLVYSGFAKDEDKLLESSSGGFATVLSEKFIQAGGCVYGVAYAPSFKKLEYVCAESLDDLKKIKGSKYTECNKIEFRQIEECLKNGRKVLFIGLGCSVGAVLKFLEKQNLDLANFFTIDVLCSGPVPAKIHELFIDELEKKYKSKLISFASRTKKNSWMPYYLIAKFENGKVYSDLFEYTDYGFLFQNLVLNKCQNCHFKGDCHKGDLCIGDCWGLKEGMSGWNKNGVSVVIEQTEKGKSLLSLLGNDFDIQKIDDSIVLKHNPAYFESRKEGLSCDNFLSLLEKESLPRVLRKNKAYRQWKRKIRLIKLKRIVLKILEIVKN